MPSPRTRVPPDVARRLAALTGRVLGDATVPVDPARPPDVVLGDPAGPAAPTVPVNPAPARSGGGPDRGRAGWTPQTPAGVRAVRPAGAWEPSVAAALAAAAAATPPVTPAAHRVRVRWAPDWRTTAAAVVVLALVAGGVVLRASAAPRGEPVVLPTPAVTGPEPPDVPVPGTSGTAERVVVHVVGAVAQPGVVRLALGARVGDAVAAAGGDLPEADLAQVNLARVLTDGEQLVVPVAGVPPAAGPVADPTQDGLVDLGTADAATLEQLPGVGPVLAQRILEHRAEHPFTTVDELDDVAGIGPALMADLRDRVRV